MTDRQDLKARIEIAADAVGDKEWDAVATALQVWQQVLVGAAAREALEIVKERLEAHALRFDRLTGASAEYKRGAADVMGDCPTEIDEILAALTPQEQDTETPSRAPLQPQLRASEADHGAGLICATDTGHGDTLPRPNWPDPTTEMLDSPLFEAIWQRIKRWDINAPEAYVGYMGATGNHVRAILDAIGQVGSGNPATQEHAATPGRSAAPSNSPDPSLYVEVETLLKEAARLFAPKEDEPTELGYEHCAPYYLAHHVIAPLAAALRASHTARQQAEQERDRLREELRVTDELLASRQRVLDAVPECPAHGPCVPHAIEWIESQRSPSRPARSVESPDHAERAQANSRTSNDLQKGQG